MSDTYQDLANTTFPDNLDKYKIYQLKGFLSYDKEDIYTYTTSAYCRMPGIMFDACVLQ